MAWNVFIILCEARPIINYNGLWTKKKEESFDDEIKICISAAKSVDREKERKKERKCGYRFGSILREVFTIFFN